METNTIIYDCDCPICNLYTGVFVKVGLLEKGGRLSIQQADEQLMEKLDLTRARYEMPVIDNATGEVLYGLRGWLAVIGNAFPKWKFLLGNRWLYRLLNPLYKFIAYNRRVIGGGPVSQSAFNLAPEFNLRWRLALIVVGLSYTAGGIYLFGLLAGIANIMALFVVVGLYFVLLLATNLWYNNTSEQKWDYLGHLATLGFIESSLFVLTALLAKCLVLPALLFAAQGACRLFALRLHQHRVTNNGFSQKLNLAFALGAIAVVVYLAVVLN